MRGPVSRRPLAAAKGTRDGRIYADWAPVLSGTARELYAAEDFGIDWEQTVYALDGTTSARGLSLFPWARYRAQPAAVKVPTRLDPPGHIPAFSAVTPAKIHEIHSLDARLPAPGARSIRDRAYLDCARLYTRQPGLAFFIIRSRQDFRFPRLRSHPGAKRTGRRCDQTLRRPSFYPAKFYPDPLRRLPYRAAETAKHLTFLTHNFLLPTLTLTQLYKGRWQVELFFKWIKPPLRIQRFYGLSPHAVKTQIWIALSVYVRVAIVRKRLGLELNRSPMSQILSLTLFEKMPLLQAFSQTNGTTELGLSCNQLDLFNL